MAHLTPREGAEWFGECGGMQPSRRTLDRLPKTLSTHWEAHRADWEESLRASETVPVAAVVLAVSLDGVMAPMATEAVEEEVEGATAPSAAPEPKAPGTAASASSGKRPYREASGGTATLDGEEGERLSTVR